MYKPIIAFTAIAASLAGPILAAPAEARSRGHSLSVPGSHGRGFTRSRAISRQPGSIAANRSLQTNGGRGYQHSRNADWGDGNYAGSRGTTFNNGASRGRTTSAARNDDGSTSYTTTRNRLDGSTRTISGTVGSDRD
jgi:hypothetical protein